MMHAAANKTAANSVSPARNGDSGTVNPFDGPVRKAFLHEIVISGMAEISVNLPVK